MSTTIRPELSERSKYWIEKHRYYELKHFCLQYPLWRKAYANLNSMQSIRYDLAGPTKTNIINKPVETCAELGVFYLDRMGIVERTAKETDDVLSDYILKAVTNGISYDCLRARLEIPCCKDTYYDLYRRFFWLLDKERG